MSRGWSANEHRIKALPDDRRGPEKTWVCGADTACASGKDLTRCATSRNSTNYIALLSDLEATNPAGDIFLIDFQPFQPQECSDSCLDG